MFSVLSSSLCCLSLPIFHLVFPFTCWSFLLFHLIFLFICLTLLIFHRIFLLIYLSLLFFILTFLFICSSHPLFRHISFCCFPRGYCDVLFLSVCLSICNSFILFLFGFLPYSGVGERHFFLLFLFIVAISRWSGVFLLFPSVFPISFLFVYIL